MYGLFVLMVMIIRNKNIQLRWVILLLLIFLGTKVDGRVKSCSSRSGFGQLFNYDKPGKLL